MENEPLVSVLMTAYNRAKFIGEAIQSVLKSSYRNWELIVVDDQSEDETVAIAREYAAVEERIKVYVNEQNLGDYANRNKAASYANGKYLKYLDADDQIYPHGLSVIISYMESFPEAGWGLMSLSADTDKPFPFLLSPEELYRRNYFFKPVFHKAPLSSIIKKEIFESIGGFKNVRHYGDYELWHRLAKYHPCVLMHEGLVWWRGHPGQEADKRKSKPWVGIETVNSAIVNIMDKDCPLNDEEKADVLRRLRNNQINQILNQLRKGNFRVASQLNKLRIGN